MSAPVTQPKIHPLAESALLIELGDEINAALTARIVTLAAALEAAEIPGLLDIVPAYTTILLSFDPALVDSEDLAATVRHLAATSMNDAPAATRQVTIPVAYGGAFGPDLASVAEHTGLTVEEIITRHAEAIYTVACLGFAPGFAFLLGLPPELTTPRLPNPRTRVPVGSVGIGGAQTGVYPLETPGGWRLIGKTPLRLFDPNRPEPFLLQTGDQLRFQPISEADFRRLHDADD